VLVRVLDELENGESGRGQGAGRPGPEGAAARGRTERGGAPLSGYSEHTRQARQILGDGPLLAPEQKVVLETDPERARAIGRPRVQQPYLGLTNYLNNLRRLGWTDADFADGGSDALIDALAPHGDAEAIAAASPRTLDAGATTWPSRFSTRSPARLQALSNQLQLSRVA